MKKNKICKNINPTKINTYNQFLMNMDKLFNDNDKYYSKHEENKEIQNFVQNINKKYLQNLSSANYNGLTNSDIILSNLIINDANEYLDKGTDKGTDKDTDKEHTDKDEDKTECCNNIKLDFKERRLKRERNESKNLEKTIEKKNIIKEKIDIQVNIQSIQDILDLIDKYKIDESIEYNINMQSLHNIKVPLENLNNMIGMKELKQNIVDQLLYFIQELHLSSNLQTIDFMHTVISGPPGTGKTEIAKLIGVIYGKLGILKKGTFKKVTRSELIAGYLGQTAIKTKEVIQDSLGGVLFIDEAYALGNREKRDSFAKECIDTLCEALSNYKEELMVIIAGYENELEDCFFSYNQGLESRFTWRFKTDQYKGEDLYEIFIKKVKDIGWSVSQDIQPQWFKDNISCFPFFGRDIETLLAKTKIAHGKRVFCKSIEDKRKINMEDLHKGYEMYLKNENVNKRKEKEKFNQIISSIYV